MTYTIYELSDVTIRDLKERFLVLASTNSRSHKEREELSVRATELKNQWEAVEKELSGISAVLRSNGHEDFLRGGN